MKKFFAVFALLTLFSVVSCDSGLKPYTPDNKSEAEKSDDDNASDGCSTYKEYECRGDASYFCGYAEDGSLKWYFHKSCEDGCNTATGKCNPDSDGNDSGSPDDDEQDTTPEQPDNGDSEPDDTSDQTQDDSDTSIPDEGDSEPDDGDTGTNDDDTDTGTAEQTEEEKCNAAGGTWNNALSNCTRSVNCPSKPENTSWNDGGNNGQYTQTYTDANGWTPSYSSSTYSAISSGTCCYKCVSAKYNWTGEYCITSLGNICTGQKKCYNNSEEIICPSSTSADFYGQDAQLASKCTAQSFTALSDVIIDNNTGLTWEKSPSSDTYTWDNRKKHCDKLNTSNYGGKNNWRVPNTLEFLTITDSGRYNPAVNTAVFQDMPADEYLWASEQYSSDQGRRFRTHTGYAGFNSKTSTYKVLCVSGDEIVPAASSDFVTSSDGKTISDTKTGLMWQKEYESDQTWQQALAYCQSLNTDGYGGYTDWRLPNRNELASLLDPAKSAAPYSNFPDITSSYFWSSSTRVYDTDDAWHVGFSYGCVGNYDSYYDKVYTRHVRCVR